MRKLKFLAAVVAAVLVLATLSAGAAEAQTVFSAGLDNPRGLTFGPDGNLYVGEGGAGGPLTTTPDQCEQVPFPVGPYSGPDRLKSEQA